MAVQKPPSLARVSHPLIAVSPSDPPSRVAASDFAAPALWRLRDPAAMSSSVRSSPSDPCLHSTFPHSSNSSSNSLTRSRSRPDLLDWRSRLFVRKRTVQTCSPLPRTVQIDSQRVPRACLTPLLSVCWQPWYSISVPDGSSGLASPPFRTGESRLTSCSPPDHIGLDRLSTSHKSASGFLSCRSVGRRGFGQLSDSFLGASDSFWSPFTFSLDGYGCRIKPPGVVIW